MLPPPPRGLFTKIVPKSVSLIQNCSVLSALSIDLDDDYDFELGLKRLKSVTLARNVSATKEADEFEWGLGRLKLVASAAITDDECDLGLQRLQSVASAALEARQHGDKSLQECYPFYHPDSEES